MNNELELYKRSKGNIWTDNWISKNMLSAHLDLANDAASRNIKVINKTIDWIRTIIKPDSSILDLGCGPGLYTEILAKNGYTVSGIDISKRSIKFARNSAKKHKLSIYYQNNDYIEKKINGNYDCITCIYCDFGALIPIEQTILLNNIHNSLNANGVFIFDVFTDKLANERKDKKQWTYYKGSSFWSKKPSFVLDETRHFPNEHTWGNRSIVINNMKKEYISWDTYYTKQQIAELLQNNCFIIEEVKEDLVDQNSFTSNSVMFIKARKI